MSIGRQLFEISRASQNYPQHEIIESAKNIDTVLGASARAGKYHAEFFYAERNMAEFMYWYIKSADDDDCFDVQITESVSKEGYYLLVNWSKSKKYAFNKSGVIKKDNNNKPSGARDYQPNDWKVEPWWYEQDSRYVFCNNPMYSVSGPVVGKSE